MRFIRDNDLDRIERVRNLLADPAMTDEQRLRGLIDLSAVLQNIKELSRPAPRPPDSIVLISSTEYRRMYPERFP